MPHAKYDMVPLFYQDRLDFAPLCRTTNYWAILTEGLTVGSLQDKYGMGVPFLKMPCHQTNMLMCNFVQYVSSAKL